MAAPIETSPPLMVSVPPEPLLAFSADRDVPESLAVVAPVTLIDPPLALRLPPLRVVVGAVRVMAP